MDVLINLLGDLHSNCTLPIWKHCCTRPVHQVTGFDGAGAISQLLWERGVRQLAFIVDEGLTVTNGIVPGMAAQTAMWVHSVTF